MHRPPVLNVDDLQEKNTFIHVPETPMSTVPIPLRTTPASFAPPNVFQQQRKRPDTINTVPETGVASGSGATQQVLPTPAGKEVTGLSDNHALVTPQYTPSPSRPNYYGETPTTMKAAAHNLKLADFVATPKAGETEGSPKVHGGARSNSGSSHQHNQQWGSQGSAVGRPSNHSAHSGGQPGGYLPMLNSSLVSGPAPTTQIAIQPVPDVSWCQNVELALAAESAKISAPYTGVGKSLTRAIF